MCPMLPTPTTAPASPFPAALAIDPTALPPGWNSQAIADGTAQLTVFFALQRQLVRVSAAWLAGVPYWDAKQAIAHHLLEDAESTEQLLKRLHELKVSSAEHRQIESLENFVLDLAAAPDGDAWLRTLYQHIKPWLCQQLDGYLQRADAVMDEPSRVVLTRTIDKLRQQSAWFTAYRPRYSTWETPDSRGWCDRVAARLAAVRGDDGTLRFTGKAIAAAPFGGIAQVRRDRTFRVQNKTTFPREGSTYAEKRFLVFYNHSQEMQFAESLAAILFETAEMPWAFHFDLARHLADEVRHATMGETRLAQLGVALTEVPMLTQHYEFRSNLDPLERFCLMTLVMEATAFERKRGHVELFEAHGDRVSALYESYDIKDEMLHTNLGHLWVPILLRVYHDSRSTPELVEHCRALIAQVITEYPANAANMLKR
jgi:hypothetical protein